MVRNWGRPSKRKARNFLPLSFSINGVNSWPQSVGVLAYPATLLRSLLEVLLKLS
jgi:hypothetical protein